SLSSRTMRTRGRACVWPWSFAGIRWWAADGATGLEVLRRERPRVAVLDIGLPGMDGYELARRIREELGPGIVLVALTGYGRARDGDEAIRAGFDRHLIKPVDVDELVRVLSEMRRSKAGV